MSTNLIKKLRDETGAGVMSSKKALLLAKGDFDKAKEFLKREGKKLALDKATRETSKGLIEAYVHSGGKIGSMVLLCCETDFVARTEDFKDLAHDLAMQVAATNPFYLDSKDIPKEVIEKEKEFLRKQFQNERKNKEVLEKIMAGKLQKYYQENCLLKQPFIKDDKITIEDLLNQKIAKLKENIQIKKFTRFSL